MYVAQCRSQWPSLKNTTMNLLVPCKKNCLARRMADPQEESCSMHVLNVAKFYTYYLGQETEQHSQHCDYATDQTVRGSTPIRGKTFLSSPKVLPSPPFDGYRGSFVGVKRPGFEGSHSPQSSDEIKNEWIYTSTPSVCFHGVESENFYFYYFDHLCKLQ